MHRSRIASCGHFATTSQRACASPGHACHAVDLFTEDQRAQEAIEDLEADRRPPCHVRAPIYRSREAAARNGVRAFLAVLISAILFVLGGWPFASLGLALVGVTIAFSAIRPSPREFAVALVIAMPITALLAGVTEFLILDGVDQFPLLAIGMAPSVLGAALLVRDALNEKLDGIEPLNSARA
jgi:uncharacterized membrane protein YccC